MAIPMMGDFRESLGLEVCQTVEKYANKIPSSDMPCYIVVCAKTDRYKPGQINASIQHYKDRPPKYFGLLIWYVDRDKGILDFVPELSLPPDIPLDPKDMSTDPKDAYSRIVDMGQSSGVILS